MTNNQPNEPFGGYDPNGQYDALMQFIIDNETYQANVIGDWVISNITTNAAGYIMGSVIDIGCGPGTYLLPFTEAGYRVFGIDACHIGGSQLREGEFERVDLRFPYWPKKEFDLAICLEVAEHLEEQWADTLMNTISASADLVLFSAAIPGQGGTYHYNEQPHEYWLKKFNERGYEVHPYQDKMREFLATLPDHVSPWLKNNTFLMVRREQE